MSALACVFYFCNISAQNNAIFNGGNADGFAIATLGGPGTEVSLPIELLSFTADRSDQNIILKWITASEVNNDFFDIERSQDSKWFEKIATVKGSGTTSTTKLYNTIDRFPLTGLSYYRLKQTDFDGRHSYSQIIPFDFFMSKTMNVSVYPNPLNISNSKTITLNITGIENKMSVLVVLRNVLGEEYYSKVMMSETGETQFVIENYSSLSKGVYFISASSNDRLISKKLIVE